VILANRKKFYTASEAAEEFGVDRRTISRWVTSGKIKAIITAGGHLRILRSEINALLDKNGFSKCPPSARSILVVDDDESVRKTLSQRLARENFLVETASDGFNAGLKVRDTKPDLVILDLMMEGIDGFEVCRSIKSNDALKETKILIMTGYDTPENRERAIREGADDYLAKSGSFKNILKHINKLCSA
ncbi:MAG: response regulator, partial [Desulfobulbaceae bacterium]|nr:response regulator [Desulfobulbaceae bacterium]